MPAVLSAERQVNDEKFLLANGSVPLRAVRIQLRIRRTWMKFDPNVLPSGYVPADLFRIGQSGGLCFTNHSTLAGC